MSDSISLTQPFLVTGGDGSTLWTGAGFPPGSLCVPTTVAISADDALVVDPAGFKVQASNLAATSAPVQQVLGLRPAITTGNYDRMFVGVALEAGAIATAAVPTYARYAGVGWFALVKVASATGTAGHYAVATSTAGTVSSTATLPTVPVGYLGKVVKPSGTSGGVTDTGTATRMGVLVNPS